MWGGGEERMKIAWVSWANVCRPKHDNGLRIKILEWPMFKGKNKDSLDVWYM